MSKIVTVARHPNWRLPFGSGFGQATDLVEKYLSGWRPSIEHPGREDDMPPVPGRQPSPWVTLRAPAVIRRVSDRSLAGLDEPGGPVTLHYDPDCGFCTTAAGWLRRRKLAAQVAPLGPAAAGRGVDLERAAREIPFVGADGSVRYGAGAIGAALATSRSPLWRTIGRVLASRPGALLATPGYRWVAANRHHLPGGQPSCRLDP